MVRKVSVTGFQPIRKSAAAGGEAEEMPVWARDAGLAVGDLPMVSFKEAMRRYPDLRDAVDLVQKAFKATPHDFNGRPIL